MPTIGTDNKKGTDSRYVSVLDIKGMNPCWFQNNTNPVTGEMCGNTQLLPADLVDIMTNKITNDPNNKSLDPVLVRAFFTTEVNAMSPCLFQGGVNPATKALCASTLKQGFQNYNPDHNPVYNNNNHGFNDDVAMTIKYLYFISLAVLIYYIIKNSKKL